MGLKLITPPATDPISLADAKDHLRVVSTDNDAYITAAIKSATSYAEDFLGRALIDQTWDLILDAFPVEEIKIPKPPLIQVVGVFYFDPNAVEQTIDPNSYYVDNASEPGWIVPQGDLTWPTTLSAINSVRVRFRAGYLDNGSPPTANVPGNIIAAIKLTVGALFENREQVIVSETRAAVNVMPWGAEQLLRQKRIELSIA